MDWQVIVTHLYQLGIAYLLALPIAWNREQEVRTAGLRTFPLVAVAACGYMLVGLQVLSSTDAEARVMYGVIVGLGFIGGQRCAELAPSSTAVACRAARSAAQ